MSWLDVYSIGEWCWQTHEDPDLMKDPLYVAGGGLCVIRVIPGLGDAIKVDGWIVALMKDRFSKMLDYLEQLVKRYDEAIATLEKEFDKFIPLIVTRVSGSPRPKGSFAKKADAPQSHTTAESRAASPSSGSKSESTDAPTATKQSDAKPGGDKGKDQPPKKQSPEKNTP
ncbi:hypothetical protein BV918_22315, partial [Pectobacterium odoriferum]